MEEKPADNEALKGSSPGTDEDKDNDPGFCTHFGIWIV